MEVEIEGRNRELESYTPQFTCLDGFRIDSRKPPSNAAKYWASARAPTHNSETSRPALLGILIPPTPRVPVRDQKKENADTAPSAASSGGRQQADGHLGRAPPPLPSPPPQVPVLQPSSSKPPSFPLLLGRPSLSQSPLCFPDRFLCSQFRSIHGAFLPLGCLPSLSSLQIHVASPLPPSSSLALICSRHETLKLCFL